ncbi:testis-expressed protein 52 [Aplysia californica]|uniref:Testis-expressed protein 52 n=1 Tax=Aplysia californica TaxID=6500 RepID=A0ABM0JE00_APLCA|nr:testis-expressed protein 52 [Aplysia californica]
MDKAATKLSLEERENLMVPQLPHRSGFTPRPVERLTSRSRPHTMVDIECCHFLRTPSREFTVQQPTVEHRLWVEAGKHDAPFPTRPDTSYNSNIWRNFRKQFGLNFSPEGKKVTDVIAAMYPLNIPAASNVGENTFEKYIKETRLFQNPKAKNLAIRRTKTDVHEFKQLKCKSDGRHPPINEKGDILPPENYKKYAHRFMPVPSPPPSPPPPGQKTDLFGQRYVPRSQPVLWKLSYKLNHPEFQKLREEVKKRREMMEQNKKERSTMPRVMPSPMLSTTPTL